MEWRSSAGRTSNTALVIGWASWEGTNPDIRADDGVTWDGVI